MEEEIRVVGTLLDGNKIVTNLVETFLDGNKKGEG